MKQKFTNKAKEVEMVKKPKKKSHKALKNNNIKFPLKIQD